MNCENCGNEHNGFYGSGRFCSSKCARGFSTKEKRSLINEKIKNTLTKDPFEKICPECKERFESKKKRKKFCSVRCGVSFNNRKKWKDDNYRNKMSSFAKERHINGELDFGWRSRKKMKLSYPEFIAKNKLEEIGIPFEREYSMGKYFIDFAIIQKKIAIEIDGQQHNIPERIKTDKEKDLFIKSQGWEIFRIKFPGENIRERIDQIILESSMQGA